MPKAPNTPYLRYTSLGGLGEVGMNCALFEVDGRIIILDCGVTFPESMHYGINLIIPDFAPIVERKDSIEALVLTHGHMDHLGAVPWLLEQMELPIYGPAFAIELVRSMLQERELLHRTKLHIIDEDSVEKIGPFELEFPSVNHSIPHAHSVLMRTPVGNFVHTGDFKIDHNPILEEPFDMARFAEIGGEGVRGLFSDSTNAQRPGKSGSERDVAAGLHAAVRDCKGRVFAALFSSNVFRVHSLMAAARLSKRKVCLLGRSLRRAVTIARTCGIIPDDFARLLVDPREASNLRDEDVLYICTGSQAEPRAALTRLSNDDYPRMRLHPGDTVLFSSRVIPGNEQYVYRLYDQLERQDVTVITPDVAPIHCSGHGYQEDMRMMLRLLTPEELVPVHGDHRYQRAHARLGRECGVEDTHIVDNGDVLEFTKNDTRVVGAIRTGRFLVDGQLFDDIEGDAFRSRRQIARSGVVTVHLTVDAQTGELAATPVAQQLGAFSLEGDGASLLAECKTLAIETYEGLDSSQRADLNQAAEQVRRDVRRHLREQLDRKPVVTVHVQTSNNKVGRA